ncbi:hypothetical protein H5410_061576 [Solanum commersonii]|uniref:Uncharacterized protein n=1 Tax=Solanum commersonii TaxID=4109 RepID=A0A9J5W8E8_SOLCO|nr:hypothetical protein H5410_061576 [Solanum commersonii]
MSTHSLGHQSSGLGFATSLSGKLKTHEIEKTHFQLGKDKLLSSSSQKPSPNLRENIKKYYSILEIKIKV